MAVTSIAEGECSTNHPLFFTLLFALLPAAPPFFMLDFDLSPFAALPLAALLELAAPPAAAALDADAEEEELALAALDAFEPAAAALAPVFLLPRLEVPLEVARPMAAALASASLHMRWAASRRPHQSRLVTRWWASRTDA